MLKQTEVRSLRLNLYMEYQQLGYSSLNISRIGLGCMSLDPEMKSKVLGIIHRAIELGINYFDTADLYNKGSE